MPPPTCRICAENYSNDNRPLLMPCGRSMCQACVRRWLQNPSQRCFVCLGQHTGVQESNLQVNFDLLEASLPAPPDTNPRSQEQSSGMLQLVLLELDGAKYQLRAPATSTIRTVKNLIKDQYGFHPQETRLMFSGEVLQDSRTLASYGLKTGNTLQMLTKYEGGGVFSARL